MASGHVELGERGGLIFFIKGCHWKWVHCPFKFSEYYSKRMCSVSQEAA